MKSEFIDLGFDKYFFCKGIKSITGEFTQNNRCGIYILHFENGEHYVGLAIDVVRRYAQHRKTYDDIEFISFKEVAQSKLPEIEKSVVYTLESQGKILRNINIVSIVNGETDLDLIVTPEKQNEWLVSEECPEEKIERFDYPDLRQRYASKFKRLQQHEFFDDIAHTVNTYTILTLPFPKSTEYSFWSVSCLPSTHHKTIARFNISWQETFVIYEGEYEYLEESEIKSFNGLGVSIWLAKSILEKHHDDTSLSQRFPSYYTDDNIHATGGQDQKRIELELSQYYEFLQLEGVVDSMKAFNLRLMRKGGCQWKRYHCFDLADIALISPDTWDAEYVGAKA